MHTGTAVQGTVILKKTRASSTSSAFLRYGSIPHPTRSYCSNALDAYPLSRNHIPVDGEMRCLYV